MGIEDKRKKAVDEMKSWMHTRDNERAHCVCDDVLLDFLRQIGEEEVAGAYEAVQKEVVF